MHNNNDNKEVLEAISELSQHVDKQVNGVREDMGKMKTDLQGEMGKMKGDLKGEIGKLRSDLIDHVTRTVANIPTTAKDQRVDKVVHKLKERNIFNAADVLEVFAHTTPI